MSDYTPPDGGLVSINFSGDYTQPNGDVVALEFSKGTPGHVGDDQYLFPQGHEDSLVSGQTLVKLHTRYVEPDGIQSLVAFGAQKLYNYLTYVRPGGIAGTSYGNPTVYNWFKQAWTTGFHEEWYGIPYVWNLLQIRKITGFDSLHFGDHSILGGVKFISVSGRLLSGYGTPEVINTTADQYVNLSGKGIKSPGVGRPWVSPRMLYPDGILGTGYSDGHIVQFPPFPKGWESSRYGRPVVDYWTKWITDAGVPLGEPFGYPKVFDPTQVVFASPVLGTGVFGDILIRNLRRIIEVPGNVFFQGSNWTEVRSNRRFVESRGILATEFGGTEIRNKTPSIIPVGIQPDAPSPVTVGHAIRYIYCRGLDLLAVPDPEIDRTPSIFPDGIYHYGAGEVIVWYGKRQFHIDGYESFSPGEATVWFRVRRIPIEGEYQGASGNPSVTHGVREIIAHGALHSGQGRPRIENKNRSVLPESIFTEFHHVHMVGTTRWVKPYGFDSSRFGTRVKPESQVLYPEGFREIWGMPEVWNHTTVVIPEGYATGSEPLDQWGLARVFNLRQIVSLYYHVESGLNPPEFGAWTKVENRNRAIRVSGVETDKFGYVSIFNNARLLSPEGIPQPWGDGHDGFGMVAHRVRHLYLDGLEPPYLSGWSRIYNDAFVIAPDGERTDVYGQSSVKNTRRYFDRIGRLYSQEFGTPMVADRIRTIAIESRYGIFPPRINLHEVKLYTRYIDGIGEDMFRWGLASLSIHFNKIHTRWSHRDWFGWSEVRNLTPELHTRGRASDEFGTAFVRLEWRPVAPDGTRMDLFGKATIGDRDRTIPIRGFRSWVVSDKLVVTKTGQPPYTDQHIYLFKVNEEGEQSELGYGISVPYKQVSKPVLNQCVLYAKGFLSTDFGTAFCQSNAIMVNYGIKADQYGNQFIGLMDRTVEIELSSDYLSLGKPGLSPYTVWARPATSQAIQNHPPHKEWKPVGKTILYPPGERFGTPRVSTWIGEIYADSIGKTQEIGRPYTTLKLTIVEVESIKAYRFGWHKIGDGTQEIRQFNGVDTSVFGLIQLDFPPYTGPQYIAPPGMGAYAGGQNRVELLHRTVFAAGSDTLRMGDMRQGDTPYMWQGLAVGPRYPTIPDGFVAEQWGEAWASMGVRDIGAIGFCAFISEYDLRNFDKRMRVRNAYIPVPGAQTVAPVGVDLGSVDEPDIRLGVRFIRPDGDSDQFRKGASDARH